MQRTRLPLLLRSTAAVAAWLSLGAAVVVAQTTAPAGELLPVGMQPFEIPPAISQNETPARLVQLLGEALAANPNALRRVELVRDLGRCKLAAAAAPVTAAAGDPDPAVRAEAARSLGLIGDRAVAGNALRKLLTDDRPAVRCEAVRASAALNDPALVTAGLNDPDESVFAAGCAVATTPDHADRIASRLPALSRQAKPVALRALGRQAATAHATLVAGQLGSKDLPIAIAAIEALDQMKATTEAAAVRELLGHEHPTVRRAAASAMAVLVGAEEQIAIARALLEDADPSVRAAAARLLVAHPSPDMVSSLIAQLSVGHGPLRQAARDALVATAGVATQSTVDGAAKLLDDPDPRRREDGSFILGQTRSDVALTRHVALLSDVDWAVVAQAAQSLGRIGRNEPAVRLAELAAQAKKVAESGSMDAMQVAAIGNAFIACGQLRHKPIVELAKPLISEKTTYPPTLRVPAIWAAGAASDADDRDVAGRCLSVCRDTTPFEVEAARFEAIKAIGNMRYAAAVDELRKEAGENPSPNLRWMAHQVVDRLSNGGARKPYTPPSVPMIADTSIKVLDRQ